MLSQLNYYIYYRVVSARCRRICKCTFVAFHNAQKSVKVNTDIYLHARVLFIYSFLWAAWAKKATYLWNPRLDNLSMMMIAILWNYTMLHGILSPQKFSCCAWPISEESAIQIATFDLLTADGICRSSVYEGNYIKLL